MTGRRYWFAKPYADFVARLRVPGGFVLVAAFVWLSQPSAHSLAWGAGHLAKDITLATGGPYAHLRNPLYAGTLLAAAGLAVASQRVELAALFAAVFGLVYLPVIELEEQHLRKLFPEYAAYAERVPILWPRLAAQYGAARFSWCLYRKNQEYQALAGFLAGAGVLAWKALS
jgi:protein-S-isoprenylcysteine O-methyltransferase Ste14